MVRALENDELRIRRVAWKSLKAITGETFDYDPYSEKDTRLEAAAKWQEWLASESRG